MNEREFEIKRCEEAIERAKKLLDDIINDDNISNEVKEHCKKKISYAEKYLESLKKV